MLSIDEFYQSDTERRNYVKIFFAFHDYIYVYFYIKKNDSSTKEFNSCVAGGFAVRTHTQGKHLLITQTFELRGIRIGLNYFKH